MEKTAFFPLSKVKAPPIGSKSIMRTSERGKTLHDTYSNKEKEAGIGSALRTVGSKASKGIRRLAAPPAPKIGLTKAVMGGGVVGGVGGAAEAAMNRRPGESGMDAMSRGLRTGAMVGAGGGLVGRHFGNKALRWNHNRRLGLNKAAALDPLEQRGEPPQAAPGVRVPARPLTMHRTGGERKDLDYLKKSVKKSGVGNEAYSGSVDDQGYA